MPQTRINPANARRSSSFQGRNLAVRTADNRGSEAVGCALASHAECRKWEKRCERTTEASERCMAPERAGPEGRCCGAHSHHFVHGGILLDWPR